MKKEDLSQSEQGETLIKLLHEAFLQTTFEFRNASFLL